MKTVSLRQIVDALRMSVNAFDLISKSAGRGYSSLWMGGERLGEMRDETADKIHGAVFHAWAKWLEAAETKVVALVGPPSDAWSAVNVDADWPVPVLGYAHGKSGVEALDGWERVDGTRSQWRAVRDALMRKHGSLAAVAAVLDVHPDLVRRWIVEDVLPSFRRINQALVLVGGDPVPPERATPLPEAWTYEHEQEYGRRTPIAPVRCALQGRRPCIGEPTEDPMVAGSMLCPTHFRAVAAIRGLDENRRSACNYDEFWMSVTHCYEQAPR